MSSNGDTIDFPKSLRKPHFCIDEYLMRSSDIRRAELTIVRQKWFRYGFYLEKIHRRHDDAQSVLKESLARISNCVDAEERSYATEAVTLHSNDVLFEIESFYLFSKILLDRIADTIEVLFRWKWKKRTGSSHVALCNEFLDLRSGLRLEVEPADLPVLQQSLRERIVQPRNKLFDHATDFDPVRLRFALEASTMERIPSHGNITATDAENRTNDLDTLLQELDRYMLATIAFLCVNMNAWSSMEASEASNAIS